MERILEQIKTFQSTSPVSLELQVNTWIKESDIYVNSIQMTAVSHDGSLYYIATVIYEI